MEVDDHLDLLKLWKGLWHTLYMADQVAVQHALSKHLSRVLWCVVGTEEEDNYAAQVYLDMTENALEDDEEGDGDEMMDYDRYAPIGEADRFMTWSDACVLVQASYAEFHPRMGEIVGQFYEGRWIDAALAPANKPWAPASS